jgi:hypothetical protein
MRARTGDNDNRAKSLGRAALVLGTGDAAPAITDHRSAIDVATPVPTLTTSPPALSVARAIASNMDNPDALAGCTDENFRPVGRSAAYRRKEE